MDSIFGQVPYLQDLSADAQTTLTQVLVAIGAFIILWLLRKVIASILIAPLRKFASFTNTKADDMLVEALKDALTYMLLGLLILVGAVIFDLRSGQQSFIFRLTLSLVFLGIFKFFYDLARQVLQSPETVEQFSPFKFQKELLPVTRISVKILIALVALVTVANIWNFNVASLVAGIGLTGLALSLAAKEVLDDVMGFAIIIGDDPFKVDEYVVSPFAEGIVESIGVRATRVRQLNQGLAVVPNSKLANDWIINWSRLEKRWFNFMLGVTYTSTAGQVEELASRIKQMLAGREAIDDNSIVVLFTEYEESSLGLLIRCYVDIADWTEAHAERHAVNLEIMRIVDELNMSVAFPSRSIYLEQVPAAMMPGSSSKTPQAGGAQAKQSHTDGKDAATAYHHHRSGTSVAAETNGGFSEGSQDQDDLHDDPHDADRSEEGRD